MRSFSEFQQAQAQGRAGARRTVVIPAQARGFQGRRAGLVTRSIAAGMDLVLISAATFALAVAFQVLDQFLTPWFNLPIPTVQAYVAIGVAALWLYATWSWSATGRTLGNQLMGLRVLDRRGAQPGLRLSAVRALCCIVFPLGLLWVLASGANRSAQDVLLRTTVVYDWVNDLPTRMPWEVPRPSP